MNANILKAQLSPCHSCPGLLIYQLFHKDRDRYYSIYSTYIVPIPIHGERKREYLDQRIPGIQFRFLGVRVLPSVSQI